MTSILFLFCSLFMTSNWAWAQTSTSIDIDPPATEVEERYRFRIEETLRGIRELEPRCAECELFTAGQETPTASPACRKTYRDLYHIKDNLESETAQDRDVDVRVMFGYMDFGNDVDDEYATLAFEAQLLSPCQKGQFACGFKAAADDLGMYTKKIQVMGPDGLLRTRNMKVSLTYSSATNSERENRGASSEQQKTLTAENEETFKQGLRQADVFFYVGHARDGGGPDFAPPVVNPRTRHTDFNWYHKNTPGVNRMKEALSGARKTPRILGLFACFADQHYGDFLKTAAPRSGLILAGRSEFETITGQAIAALDSTIGMRCEEEFTRAVNVIKNIESYDITPVKVDGVFRTSK